MKILLKKKTIRNCVLLQTNHWFIIDFFQCINGFNNFRINNATERQQFMICRRLFKQNIFFYFYIRHTAAEKKLHKQIVKFMLVLRLVERQNCRKETTKENIELIYRLEEIIFVHFNDSMSKACQVSLINIEKKIWKYKQWFIVLSIIHQC